MLVGFRAGGFLKKRTMWTGYWKRQLKRKSVRRRLKAIEKLRLAEGVDFDDALIAATADRDPQVRHHAEEALAGRAISFLEVLFPESYRFVLSDRVKSSVKTRVRSLVVGGGVASIRGVLSLPSRLASCTRGWNWNSLFLKALQRYTDEQLIELLTQDEPRRVRELLRELIMEEWARRTEKCVAEVYFELLQTGDDRLTDCVRPFVFARGTSEAKAALDQAGFTTDADFLDLWQAIRAWDDKKVAAYGHQATPYLIAALDGLDHSLRRNAIPLLGQIKDPAAVPVLVRLIQSPNEDSSLCDLAADALAKIGDVSALPVLTAQVDSESNSSAIWRAYGSLGGETVVDALKRHLSGSHRLKAISALGKTRSPHALTELGRILKDDDRSWIPYVAEAIGETGLPAALNMLLDSWESLRGPTDEWVNEPRVCRIFFTAVQRILEASAGTVDTAALRRIARMADPKVWVEVPILRSDEEEESINRALDRGDPIDVKYRERVVQPFDVSTLRDLASREIHRR